MRKRIVFIYLALSLVTPGLQRCGYRSQSCCSEISTDHLLDAPPDEDGLELGGVGVEPRFDNKAVVANLAGIHRRTAYFYSGDGGTTWRRDRFYQDLRAWQSRTLEEGEILPWDPSPMDPAVKYRTIHFPQGRSYAERSTDGGKSWITLNGLIQGCCAKLSKGGGYFYHPRDPLTLYRNGSLPGSDYGGEMFVSVDGGDSFRFMYNSAGTPVLAISQSDPKVMYGAAALGSVVKSRDGGKLWDLVGQNDLIRTTFVRNTETEQKNQETPFIELRTDVTAIAIDPSDSNTVYLATSKGLLRSENGGKTWCILNTGITKARAIHSIVITPRPPYVLLVGTYKGLMRSEDGGCHWEWVDIMSRLSQ